MQNFPYTVSMQDEALPHSEDSKQAFPFRTGPEQASTKAGASAANRTRARGVIERVCSKRALGARFLYRPGPYTRTLGPETVAI
jgi:hypothetical protein